MHEAKTVTEQRFLRECLLWKNLTHEHIVPFLGVSNDAFKGKLCMVIAWMDGGTVESYIAKQRKEGRLCGEDSRSQIDLWVRGVLD